MRDFIERVIFNLLAICIIFIFPIGITYFAFTHWGVFGFFGSLAIYVSIISAAIKN